MAGVDNEIEDIRRSVQKVNRALYKFYRNIQNATGRVGEPLDAFDSALRGAREEVAKVRGNFDAVIIQFPSYFVFVAIFVVIEVIIFAIFLFLFYKILEGILELRRRGKMSNGPEEVVLRRRSPNWRRTKLTHEDGQHHQPSPFRGILRRYPPPVHLFRRSQNLPNGNQGLVRRGEQQSSEFREPLLFIEEV